VPSFLPPGTGSLLARVSARNARRIRRAAAGLAALARSPEERGALAALRAAMGSLRGAARSEFLTGPRARAWIAGAEEAIALARPARGLSDLDLFDIAAPGPHLKELLPSGSLDRAFRRRAAALGARLARSALARIPPLVAFLTPAEASFGPLRLDLDPDGEEARAAGEIHLAHPVPATYRLPPGTRMELAGGGVRFLIPKPARRARALPAAGHLRETIPGSGIVVARRMRWTPGGLRPAGRLPGLAARLGAALDLLRRAWPEGHREVLAHTREVVPLEERNTVSFSLPGRPGTSYINVRGKSLVDLADDLLHESAHHRLHGLEEVAGSLVRDDGEPRYRSPWRRSVRPVHGILHGAYTFAYRAELLGRLAALDDDAGRRLPRAWLRREAALEIRMLRGALADLEDAGRRALLTPAGRRLVRAIARRLAKTAGRTARSRR
jgi:hypothetical protein